MACTLMNRIVYEPSFDILNAYVSITKYFNDLIIEGTCLALLHLQPTSASRVIPATRHAKVFATDMRLLCG